MRNVLYYFIKKHKGNWNETFSSLVSKEEISNETYLLTRKKIPDNLTTIVDSDYPKNLQAIYKPPFALFKYGNKSLLENKLIGIYGESNSIEIQNDITSSNIFTYIVSFENKKMIYLLLNNNINFIVVLSKGNYFDKNSNLIKKILDQNNLILSEMPINNTKEYNDQSHLRIVFGLSKKMMILDEKNECKEFSELIDSCKSDNIYCFGFKKSNINYINYHKNLNSFNMFKELN